MLWNVYIANYGSHHWLPKNIPLHTYTQKFFSVIIQLKFGEHRVWQSVINSNIFDFQNSFPLCYFNVLIKNLLEIFAPKLPFLPLTPNKTGEGSLKTKTYQ